MYDFHVLFVVETEELLKNAKLLCDKQPENRDYYKILGIDEQASLVEIRKSYYQKAKIYHPGFDHCSILFCSNCPRFSFLYSNV